MKNIIVVDKSNKTKNHKAKKKSATVLKNIAIFFSAFFVLYFFFVITFGNVFSSEGKTTFYVLSQGTYDNLAQASSEADNIKILGGSGNIWVDDDEYMVIAFVYNNADSAREVQNRLSDEGLDLTLEKIEINTSKLDFEEGAFVNSLIDVSNRIYDIMVGLPEMTSETQTNILIDEVKKSAVTAVVRAEILLENGSSVENATVAGELVLDAFSEVTLAQTTSSQSLGWLRSQILIYAYDFTKNN